MKVTSRDGFVTSRGGCYVTDTRWHGNIARRFCDVTLGSTVTINMFIRVFS